MLAIAALSTPKHDRGRDFNESHVTRVFPRGIMESRALRPFPFRSPEGPAMGRCVVVGEHKRNHRKPKFPSLII